MSYVQAQAQRFLNQALSESLIHTLITKLGPPPRSRTPEERVLDNLDWQNEQVRDAYAVMRGEMHACGDDE